jgi:hypothetical protein
MSAGIAYLLEAVRAEARSGRSRSEGRRWLSEAEELARMDQQAVAPVRESATAKAWNPSLGSWKRRKKRA